MSSAGKAFQLGAVIVPASQALGVAQRDEWFGGTARLRMANGDGLQQTTWRKLRIVISASGWMPPGLRALDYDQPLVLKCGAPVAITSGATVIELPAARRTDAGYLPFARAHTARGDVDTAVSVAGNTATCTAVADAIGYSVLYYPQITVLADPPAASYDTSGAASSWEITCEEV